MKKTPTTFAGKIAAFVLENTPFAWLLIFGTIIAGIGGYLFTPKQYNPEITLPAFTISVAYPGATVQEVETFVTKELEEKLFDIPGVDSVISQSHDGGEAIVMVQFAVGSDPEDARTAVEGKLVDYRALAEGNIHAPHVQAVDPDSVPIMTYGFTHPGLSQNQLREKIVLLSKRIKNISGVANIRVHGGAARALTIWLDPGAMKTHNVSVPEVMQAIQQGNQFHIVGDIDDGAYRQQVIIDATIDQAAVAEQLFVNAAGVRLVDVATIQDGFYHKDSLVRVAQKQDDGSISQEHDVVFLSVAKRQGENAIHVEKKVADNIGALLATEEFRHIELTTYRNEALVAKNEIGGLARSLSISIVIVSVVLFLFLGRRAALIVALAIPFTLAWVFGIGYGMDKTINRITLFALILSLGLLVDSATVVVENISRHKQQGKPIKQAIIDAVDEVGIGLFLSTVTSVIVFLPTAYITGMMGEYMGPLSVFVPLALIVALVVAYTIIPFLATKLFASGAAIVSPLSAKFDQLTAWYTKKITVLLQDTKKQQLFLKRVLILFIVVMLFPLVQLVHFKMLPTADKDQYYIYLNAPEGTAIQRTADIAEVIGEKVLAVEEVVSVQEFIGEAPVIDFNGLFKGAQFRAQPHQATLRVNLVPKEKRGKKSEELVFAIRDTFATDTDIQVYRAEGAEIIVLEDPPGPPVQATFVAKVQGENGEVRKNIHQWVQYQLQDIDGLVDMVSSEEHGYHVRKFVLDHALLQESGVHVDMVQQTLRAYTGGVIVDQYHHNWSEEFGYIVLDTADTARDTFDDMYDIAVKNNQGEMIPLISLGQVVDTRQHAALLRDDGHPTTYITAETQGRSVVYATIDAMRKLHEAENFPVEISDISWSIWGTTYHTVEHGDYMIRWGGEWEMTIENFRDLGLAMFIAILLIFAVLVAQFRSFAIPTIIMMTIPLAMIGIMPGFALLDILKGEFLTATSLIGVIALMGIVVNNAILLLEYIQQEHARGAAHLDAVLQAATYRFRPILLTSLTTVCGSLTIINDPVWAGLAWAIVFGLSLSAVLTLVVFPVLYLQIQRVKSHV